MHSIVTRINGREGRWCSIFDDGVVFLAFRYELKSVTNAVVALAVVVPTAGRALDAFRRSFRAFAGQGHQKLASSDLQSCCPSKFVETAHRFVDLSHDQRTMCCLCTCSFRTWSTRANSRNRSASQTLSETSGVLSSTDTVPRDPVLCSEPSTVRWTGSRPALPRIPEFPKPKNPLRILLFPPACPPSK